MDASNTKSDGISIRLSQGELGFLCNAINESLNAIEEWEFQTRTGWSPEEARKLLEKFRTLLDVEV